jgi:hypothetical protein
VPVDQSGWVPESRWRNDASLRGRLKLRYALSCFGRTRADVTRAIRQAGFGEPEIHRIGTLADVGDPDLNSQALFVFQLA